MDKKQFIGKYYRYTYNGIGIYEAYHQACMNARKFDKWKAFLADKQKTQWLPNPDAKIGQYKSGYTSFFTQKGYDYFNRLVLPTFLELLDKSQITLQEFEDIPLKYELVYYDDFQVVVNMKKVITPVKEWGNIRNQEAPTQFLHEATKQPVKGGINFKPSPKRVAKKLNKKESDFILGIDHDMASMKSTIMDLFGDFGDGPMYNPYDIIEIPVGLYGGLTLKKHPDAAESSKKKNSVRFTTTVGLWIFNKAMIEPMSDVLGYINTPITDSVYGSINSKISNALLEDKVTVRQLKDFIDEGQLIMSCCSALASSHTEMMFAMEELIAKKKEELLASPKYKDMKANADLVLMKEFEKEMIDYAKDILKDDPAVDMFMSGARSSWNNNFRNMYIMRSALKHTDGHYTISTTSYIEGMDEKEYADIADSAIGGPFQRSRKTASGGYIERLLVGSTSHIRILGRGSDCKSNKTVTVNLTAKNAKDWYSSFMVIGNKLVKLTQENANEYIGKKIKFRFSALCKAKNGCICEACAGTLFNDIGITNVGVASSILGSSLKNAAMKAFHDSSANLYTVDIESAFNLK